MSPAAAPSGSTASGGLRCSVAADLRADPRVGTAPPAARWLLLEHPGPWRVDAVAGSGLDPAVLTALTTTAARTATRILLVRRPGRAAVPAPTTERRWILTGPDAATREGTWRDDADLHAAVRALTTPQPAPSGPRTPVVLVCAHGVHDACCAVRGRPVAAALAVAHPGAVWECSHVGGDRFAPNVIVLPDGFYYGGLDPESAVTTVADHLAGRVVTAHLRGMSRFAPPVQAAVVAAHTRFGPLGPDAVTVTASRHEGRYGAAGSRTFVELAVDGRPEPVRAEVVPVRRAAAQLTCRAARETIATEYRVEHLG